MLHNLLLIGVSFCSVAGFAVLLNCPSKSILYAGLCGALGWAVFLISQSAALSTVAASFFAALSVGVLGELCAIRFRRPATVFIIPGILPLVPGYGLYYTMLSIIEKNYSKAAQLGVTAIFVAFAIASGLIISSTVGRFMRSRHAAFESERVQLEDLDMDEDQPDRKMTED